MAFDKEFLLSGSAAQAIYEEIRDLPVFDIHTHVDLKMILANEPAADPWMALCHGDHYVSSIMESLGSMDRQTFFDPKTPGYDKWLAYARILPHLLGNQIRDWMRMTLAELGIERPLNADSAQAIWDELSATLQADRWRPVNLFKNSKIVLMSTTDNPVDSLEPHVEAEKVFGKGYWLPAWRPDPFFNLRPGLIKTRSWIEWIEELEKASGASVMGNLKAFRDALARRHDYFVARGCRVSDYGVTLPYGHNVTEGRAVAIFDKACREQEIDDSEAADFQAYMMRFSIGLDFEKGWVSQIHFGALRNMRDLAVNLGGLDSGCDTTGGCRDASQLLRPMLNHFDGAGSKQHKIFLYTLDKADWPRLAGLSRIFPSVYSGVSWWHFDSVSGMLEMMRTVPELGAGFRKIGPFVTDARNIYSLAPRSEVYRRVLSTVLGEAVEFRSDPLDEAKALARHLCSDHVKRFLG
ncbi:glucuronate isomerase [Candidatus Sumerlaeota bacterium]|nr:glucuronate isomerase [Candidatus Sumerlaeota bacterium]